MSVQVEARVTIICHVRNDFDTLAEARAWAQQIGPDEAMEDGVIEDVKRELVSCATDDEGDKDEGEATA